MASYKPLVLLLGAGSNIGQAVAKKFLAGGYHVALAARKLPDRKMSSQEWTYKFDLSNPSAVEDLFAKVSEDAGIPSVVIVNGKMTSYIIAV
jgi:NAD(P)-dependent dehydrogenase (short-subunit alcohol dehydrogenase family)